MRVAVVHDWLYTLGGAERVLRGILQNYPGADLFTLFDVLPQADRAWVGYEHAATSFMQRLPGIARRHRLYLPLMPLAIEQLDLSRYDLIISSSYAVAKGILTGPDQVHIAYVHSPMRYAWDLQHQYLAESRMARGPRSALARALLHYMRIWDSRTANGVTAFAANSAFVARRIRKCYGRKSAIIHPPVDVPAQLPAWKRDSHFLVASRLVLYKNVRAVVQAFRHLPYQRLIIAGSGPEEGPLRAIAGPNVSFAGFVTDAELRRLMGTAKAFVFAAEEDFGIVPVEAQGEGTPVIALGRGGARETVITRGAGRTGMFFDAPEPELIAATIRDFLAAGDVFDPRACHAQALRFAAPVFACKLGELVADEMAAMRRDLDGACARQAPQLASAG